MVLLPLFRPLLGDFDRFAAGHNRSIHFEFSSKSSAVGCVPPRTSDRSIAGAGHTQVPFGSSNGQFRSTAANERTAAAVAAVHSVPAAAVAMAEEIEVSEPWKKCLKVPTEAKNVPRLQCGMANSSLEHAFSRMFF